jgi:hypothetical protein
MTQAAADHPLRHLIGRSLPGGSYQLAGYESWLMRDAVYAEPDPLPHPIAAFVAAQRGVGITVAELFSLLESNIEDGPVLAESSIEFSGDLAVDRQYRVAGEVTAIDRKRGSRIGEFDLACCRFTIIEESGREPVATVSNVYAIPRRSET